MRFIIDILKNDCDIGVWLRRVRINIMSDYDVVIDTFGFLPSLIPRHTVCLSPQETNSPPWTNRHAVCPGCDIVDDYEVLRQFSDWSRQFLQNIIPHDHAALFTG